MTEQFKKAFIKGRQGENITADLYLSCKEHCCAVLQCGDTKLPYDLIAVYDDLRDMEHIEVKYQKALLSKGKIMLEIEGKILQDGTRNPGWLFKEDADLADTYVFCASDKGYQRFLIISRKNLLEFYDEHKEGLKVYQPNDPDNGCLLVSINAIDLAKIAVYIEIIDGNVTKLA